MDFGRYVFADPWLGWLCRGVLMTLVTCSLSELRSIRRPVLAAAVSTLGYSFLLEALQALVPWRSFDPADMVADGMGVLLFTPLAIWMVRRQIARVDSRVQP